jgi:tRNA(adenine34) deaminase
MNQRDEHYMQLAVDQAILARSNGDMPFGSVIVRDSEVVAAMQNGEHLRGDVTAHAELMAVSEASKVLGRRDLSDCTIYASIEPCPMCAAAIFQSNITRVVFGAYRDDLAHLFRRRKIRIAHLADDWESKPEVIGGVLRDEALHAFDGIDEPFRAVPGVHSLPVLSGASKSNRRA